jgi:hypothetical protein
MIVMNPGGAKSGTDTPDSVSDVVAMEMDELFALVEEEGSGQQKQDALKRWVRFEVIWALPSADYIVT